MYPFFFFARHGESFHNERTSKVLTLYPPNTSYKNLPQYLEFKYASDMMDAGMSERGKQQSAKLGQEISDKKIDIVVVSPLRRALQTCAIALKNRKDVQVFVQPLLTERMTSACDIGSKLLDSRKLFEQFDFEARIPTHSTDSWYLNEILPQESRELIEEKNKTLDDLDMATLSIMKEKKQIQSEHDVQKRSEKLKKQLMKYKAMSKQNVLVIGHGGIVKAVTATSFKKNGQPINAVNLKNGQVRRVPILVTEASIQKENEIPFCSM